VYFIYDKDACNAMICRQNELLPDERQSVDGKIIIFYREENSRMSLASFEEVFICMKGTFVGSSIRCDERCSRFKMDVRQKVAYVKQLLTADRNPAA
jgi:hypothetical protein